MANANVEKLKDLGLRHGEKVAVALVSVVCLLLLFMAWTHPVIDMTPEQVEKSAQQANQNIQRRQDEDQILAKIQDQGVVLQNFEQTVDARKPGSMDPSQFRLPNLMAAREPGAGLLREEPGLIAVADLSGHAGRGAINVFALDEVTGEIIMEKPKTDKPKKKRRKGSSGSSGMMGGGAKEKSEREKQEDKAKAERQQNRNLAAISGGLADRGFDEEDNPEDTESTSGLVEKEILQGYRWVALTGVLDNNRFRENFAKALKVDLAGAYPNYLRKELERQELLPNGEWSDWEPVDSQKNFDMVYKILTEEDPETTPKGLPLTPDNVRLDALVDTLPFLQVGYWVGVQPAELVSEEAIKELTTKPKEPEPVNGMMGMMDPNMMGAGMMDPAMMEPPMMDPGMMDPSMMMGPASEFGSMFGGPAGDTIDTNFPKSEAEKLMVRAVDFTVQPDAIYRYRLRLVVANPNYDSTTVMPGVDVASKELAGPWSEPTESVHVPPDVATYVADFSPDAANVLRNDVVKFEVVKWQPETGLTITRALTSAPGQIIGEKIASAVPDIINKKVKSQSVDFTSHRLLVDTSGGKRPISNLRLRNSRPDFDAPARALILRTDGTLVLRDEAVDANDGAMEEMKAIYKQEQDDAKEDKDKNSSMMGMGMEMMGMP
jgi:hypothetical protein